MLFCLFKLSQISKISIFTYKHQTHNQMKNIKEFYSLETWGIGLTKRTLSSILSNMFSSQFTYSSFAQLRWLANHGCTSGLLLHNWFRIRNVPPSKKAMKTNENQERSGFVRIKIYTRIQIRQLKSRIRIQISQNENQDLDLDPSKLKNRILIWFRQKEKQDPDLHPSK